MATDDSSLIDEVRTLTDYDAGIIDDTEYQDLLSVAKEELQNDVNQSVTFFSGNRAVDRALFWLLCLYSKIKVGEIEAPTFEIAEIQVRQEQLDDRANWWLRQYQKNVDKIAAGARGKIVSVSRSDRTYAFDN
ncbi:hypothetical protein ACFQL7_20880 [Halocatena marina]|uniref:DUF1320 domain-containing protein n=1 Tax=Halocatena marina TaxID=2934937 RepID=A0ABD5YSG5_9EURY|nr:hypothetical protein [Halocatena marina]